MRNRFRLRQRVVVITGGSRGLGFVLARELLLRNNRIALLVRDPEELERASKNLSGGQNVLSVPCDITNKNQVQEALRQVESRFGTIDILINNAGTIMVGPMASMTEEDYRKFLDVSFWGSFHTIQAVLPLMRKQGAGGS